MTELEGWLKQAARHLSKDSANLVRSEIEEHYDLEIEAATRGGADPEEARIAALQALGDPKEANCQYRKVLLSSSEAALLEGSNLEARIICSKLKWIFLSAPGTILLVSAVLIELGDIGIARGLLMLGALTAVLFIGPILPIYTPSRGRAFRLVKWSLMSLAVVLFFGQDLLHWSWLLASCVFPVFWTERKRVLIRRKLPVSQWPKQLYL